MGYGRDAMSETAGHELSHLSSATASLGRVFARPGVLAGFCVIILGGLGWVYLALLSARFGFVQALCSTLQDGFAGPYAAAVIFSMWCAMTLAMMLPSAAPMILTYTEIADTAARKSERIVSPFALAAGYAVVWFGFSVFAALGQIGLTRATLLDRSMALASPLLSGAIFLFAGIYQFSALKHACLTQCRHPFPVFFTNWATTPAGVFKLGVKQGLYCVGCCCAMMLLMFAVGLMNIVWMAGIGIAMTLEKLLTGRRFTYAIGVVLIAVGAVIVLTTLTGGWSPRTG
jgi:Predicted metal-binding integral membrane protein